MVLGSNGIYSKNIYPDLPVPCIFGTKLSAAKLSGNNRPLVPNIKGTGRSRSQTTLVLNGILEGFVQPKNRKHSQVPGTYCWTCTSWYGQFPIILAGFIHLAGDCDRWISEPSTTHRGTKDWCQEQTSVRFTLTFRHRFLSRCCPLRKGCINVKMWPSCWEFLKNVEWLFFFVCGLFFWLEELDAGVDLFGFRIVETCSVVGSTSCVCTVFIYICIHRY